MMKSLKWITADTKIKFISKTKYAFILSTILVLASLCQIAFKGLNYGIDFSGGILIEVKSEEKIDMSVLRKDLEVLKVGDLNLQSMGQNQDEVLIRAQVKDLDEKGQMAVVNDIKKILGDKYEYRKTELVGPQVGSELKRAGVIATVISILAIFTYIWMRFEWQFALGGCLGILHDTITTIGLFSFLGLDFNLSTVAAILTIAGYSINDTVVMFDRVRENLGKFKKLELKDLLDNSINDVLSRTLLTSLTTLLAVIAIFVFGGETLRSFSFALIWGVIIGTYSTIYVAVPMLLRFDIRKAKAAKEEEASYNPFGNVE